MCRMKKLRAVRFDESGIPGFGEELGNGSATIDYLGFCLHEYVFIAFLGRVYLVLCCYVVKQWLGSWYTASTTLTTLCLVEPHRTTLDRLH